MGYFGGYSGLSFWATWLSRYSELRTTAPSQPIPNKQGIRSSKVSGMWVFLAGSILGLLCMSFQDLRRISSVLYHITGVGAFLWQTVRNSDLEKSPRIHSTFPRVRVLGCYDLVEEGILTQLSCRKVSRWCQCPHKQHIRSCHRGLQRIPHSAAFHVFADSPIPFSLRAFPKCEASRRCEISFSESCLIA